VFNPELMRRAFEYALMFDRPILHHAAVLERNSPGVMHEGMVSLVLGLAPMPAAAEDVMTSRDIALAEATGGRVHLRCVSSLRSVEEIRQAIGRGLKVSADVTPHHLLLTDESLRSYDTNFKVDPPVRTAEHREALIAGLKDETISIIASDHQPASEEKKSQEIDQAPFGIAGLETLIPLCVEALILPGHLTWPQLIAKLTIGPAKLLGLTSGTLRPGSAADVAVIDPQARWEIDAREFRSKSRNTPFHGRPVQGRVKYTIARGEIRFPERFTSTGLS
jgi:dihydroorotase